MGVRNLCVRPLDIDVGHINRQYTRHYGIRGRGKMAIKNRLGRGQRVYF